MSDMLFDIPRPNPQPKNPTPEITPKSYKHSIVDSVKTPTETMGAYIGGSNWQVEYYSQIFGQGEELKAFDPKSLNPYQSYHKINRLIVKLQGALSNDDERDSGRYSITGSAIITPHPNLIPNVGDAFIADIGEGMAGQFTVTSVRKMTSNLASAWAIDFKHDRAVTPQIEKLLNAKVVQESYYQRDYLITGQNAIMVAEDYNTSKDLEKTIKIISQMFVSNHFSFTNHTFILPEQDMATYDPFVTRAALRIINLSDVPTLREVREYNCDDHRIPKFNDLYTAVIKRDPTLLYNTFNQYARISTGFLNPSVYQNSIRYSAIKYVVVPYRQELDVDNYNDLNEIVENVMVNYGPGLSGSGTSEACKCVADVRKSCACCDGSLAKEEGKEELATIGNLGMDIPKITDSSYVLSSGFYKRELVECTPFERQVWNLLENKPLDPRLIQAYCNHYHHWGKLEQFYLGPLLILLARAAMRDL